MPAEFAVVVLLRHGNAAIWGLRDTRPEGRTMRAHAIAVFVTGAILSAASFLVAPALAQNDVSVKPIGKVVTATGAGHDRTYHCRRRPGGTWQSARPGESW